MNDLRTRGRLEPLAIFSAALGLPLCIYLLTLAPDLTWAHAGADGGDLIVAATTLGVPHPPGYPAYTLLAHLFTLLPWSTIAFRVNLLSAVSAGAAAGAVALTIRACNQNTRLVNVVTAAMTGAWGLAFVPVLWGQAVIAEVYAPHAAFVALTIWLTVHFHGRPTPARALLLGVVWGIGFGFHVTLVFLLPIVAWAMVAARSDPGFRSKLFLFLVGFSLACLQWLYLPLRAGKGAITWGDPSTLAGWWWVVSGTLYRGYAFALPIQDWPARVAYLAGMLLLGLGPLAVLLGLGEWERLVRQRSPFILACAASLAVTVLFAIGYNTADSDSYLIPALVIFAITVGGGAKQALDGVRSRHGSRAVAGLVALLWVEPLIIVLLNWSTLSLAGDDTAVRFGKTILAAAPAQAVLLTNDDRTTFTLWYFHFAVGERPDVTIADEGLVSFDWYRASLGVRPMEGTLPNLSALFPGRPLCQVPFDAGSPHLECFSPGSPPRIP